MLNLVLVIRKSTRFHCPPWVVYLRFFGCKKNKERAERFTSFTSTVLKVTKTTKVKKGVVKMPSSSKVKGIAREKNSLSKLSVPIYVVNWRWFIFFVFVLKVFLFLKDVFLNSNNLEAITAAALKGATFVWSHAILAFKCNVAPRPATQPRFLLILSPLRACFGVKWPTVRKSLKRPWFWCKNRPWQCGDLWSFHDL